MDEKRDVESQVEQAQTCLKKNYVSPIVVALNYSIESSQGNGGDGGLLGTNALS